MEGFVDLGETRSRNLKVLLQEAACSRRVLNIDNWWTGQDRFQTLSLVRSAFLTSKFSSICPVRMSSSGFPLYAETYKIGNRVYRRNEYKPSAAHRPEDTGDTPDLFADDVEEDGPCVVDEVNTEFACRIYVPSAFYGKLIGARGTTRRELEESTECRLTIPRKGQSGNVEIKSFVGLENVQRCLDRIELLVSEARKSAPVTHFIAIPCASPEVVQSFEIFKEAVINNAGIPEESRNPELFISATKLHITVCVLWIFDDEEQKKATEVIEQCRGDILALLPDGSFGVELSGVETWEDDPKNVKVIFASIKSEPLQRICDLLRKRLVLAGLSPKTEKKLSTVDSSVRMHMTLMKSGYVDRLSAEHVRVYHGTGRNQFSEYWAIDVSPEGKQFLFVEIKTFRLWFGQPIEVDPVLAMHQIVVDAILFINRDGRVDPKRSGRAPGGEYELSVRRMWSTCASGILERFVTVVELASKPKAFDASVILEEYKDFHFGTFTVNKVSVLL
ncbi:unnamed protein product [Heligmosomoides polygyrus]|uniref:KH domain-containing protein n=1 Tax=Heligmosomoides polygyrus TaxID=6339 RepID=A0A3P7ZVB9_HELPZ|nr:unnamed protein product [Heligmosomoides polygyrus]